MTRTTDLDGTHVSPEDLPTSISPEDAFDQTAAGLDPVNLPPTVLQQHPTGVSTAVATLLVIVAAKLGVDLAAEEAALIVGAVATIVSKFTPRKAAA